ncbi:MAG: RluA family pseudouridine synthase [Treponema sp.]|nr:RluA family pseudouridine synthase [Treponema sp.]
MFPPFPQFTAHHYIQKLIDDLDCGKVKIQQITEESKERLGSGLMLGCLVAYDKKTNQRIILYALSGISRQLIFQNSENPSQITIQKEKYIILPPLVSDQAINKALLKNDKKIHELTDLINKGDKSLEKERSLLTTESLKNVFSLYNFTRFDGKKISLNQIIGKKDKLPPTGTGDCCAPKLLDYAFKHNLEILSMDEVFYGKDSKNKKNGSSYGPCDERCGYILPSILGLEILYRDSCLCLINKESGLLSVPGRGPEKIDSAESRLKFLFPETINQPAVHRLDMETSGLLLLAFDKKSHAFMNKEFEKGRVSKKYIAILDGILEKAEGLAAPKRGEKSGRIELAFRLDPDNRPHQIYDPEKGKLGITEWKNLGLINYKGKKCTVVEFIPLTGRTHQLRLAASHQKGFGLPIVGDSLYGNPEEGQRLLLHCCHLEFRHPVSGQLMKFDCPPDFI